MVKSGARKNQKDSRSDDGRNQQGERIVEDLNIKKLCNDDVDVALFVTCSHCQGLATYKLTLKGGPYGTDRTYDENCRKCYQENGKATGKRMVKVPLSDLVRGIKASG